MNHLGLDGATDACPVRSAFSEHSLQSAPSYDRRRLSSHSFLYRRAVVRRLRCRGRGSCGCARPLCANRFIEHGSTKSSSRLNLCQHFFFLPKSSSCRQAPNAQRALVLLNQHAPVQTEAEVFLNQPVSWPIAGTARRSPPCRPARVEYRKCRNSSGKEWCGRKYQIFLPSLMQFVLTAGLCIARIAIRVK